jgi:Phosphopantetheine attachment site
MGSDTLLREDVETLVVLATGRTVTVEDLRGSGGSLEAVGVNSIAYINLLEAIEQRFGIPSDLATDPAFLASVDTIVAFIRTHSAARDRQ